MLQLEVINCFENKTKRNHIHPKKLRTMKMVLSPLMLLLFFSQLAQAQRNLKTSNGWAYEIVRSGHGPQLDRSKAAETHNRLIDVNNRELVSTYKAGIPDYQIVSELSPGFQNAFSVMQEGGKYQFWIPMQDFKRAQRNGTSLSLPGDHVLWEIEIIRALPAKPDVATEVKKVIQNKGLDGGFLYFMEVSKGRDNNVYLGEWEVNELGYLYLEKAKYKEAIQIFNFNVNKNPYSANAHDSLAEAYYKSGDRQLAGQHYQKSLDLNPNNDNARQMLKKL